MTGGYETLTEKEKDTLRLLLGGHDAKSIARQLGLSVHTIHEGLRDARRKMGESSSRGAAGMVCLARPSFAAGTYCHFCLAVHPRIRKRTGCGFRNSRQRGSGNRSGTAVPRAA